MPPSINNLCDERPTPWRDDGKQRSDTSLVFADVYETYFYEVARWVRAMGVNTGEVQDITQEVFVIVHRKLSRFEGDNIRGFLYRIAQRKVRDHLRSAWFRNIGRHRVTEDAPDEMSPVDTSADVVLEQRERLRKVETILAKLGSVNRRILVLFEVEGYSGEEIAQLEGVPLTTIWTRLQNARREFFKRMNEAGDAK